MLLENILISGFLLELVILRVVLLILLENLGIVRHVLLVRCPGLVLLACLMVIVNVVEIGRANVVMVKSVLDVFKILVSDWHADLTKPVDNLVLRILSNVLKIVILAV